MAKKSGRFSKEEEKFIRENHATMSVDQLADELNREHDTMKRKIVSMGLTRDDEGRVTYDVGFELETRRYYKNLEKQFTKEEMEDFKVEWCEIIAQFNNDVLHTEEGQIVDAIKYQIMMDRCMNEQQRCYDTINRAQAELSVLEQIQQPEPEEVMEMEGLMREVGDAQAAIDASINNYVKFQKEKNTLLQKIKGVREDRVKQIENKAETFGTWLSRIITDKKLRKTLGEDLEKHKVATDVEKIRLAAYHKYEDGEIDQVLLTPETVKEDHTV